MGSELTFIQLVTDGTRIPIQVDGFVVLNTLCCLPNCNYREFVFMTPNFFLKHGANKND